MLSVSSSSTPLAGTLACVQSTCSASSSVSPSAGATLRPGLETEEGDENEEDTWGDDKAGEEEELESEEEEVGSTGDEVAGNVDKERDGEEDEADDGHTDGTESSLCCSV